MTKILNTVNKLPSSHYTELLEERTPFVFTRWGDGEWEGMLRERGEEKGGRMNCDGHEYFPDMVNEMREILLNATARSPFDVRYFGLLKIARRIYEPAIADILPGFQWVDGDILLEDFVNGQLGDFFEALRLRTITYIGPARLRPLQDMLPIRTWLECPLKNAWLEIDNLYHDLVNGVYRNEVIGLSCGPAAKVLAERLHQRRRDLTIIDFGSMFDGVCGFTTRTYHRGRDWTEIARQMQKRSKR